MGNIFKNLRKAKQLTQKELADIFNVDQTTVSKWEVGKAIPDYGTLQKLADFYNVSIDYLLGRAEKDSTETIDSKALILENEFAQRGITAEKFNALPDNKKQLLYNLIIDMIESNGQK